ncbi:hypothetical protein BGZ68_003914 [Mortierella alpina]|nr:hypothetical protein BGZ68_003914 [Mortierella alpina]
MSEPANTLPTYNIVLLGPTQSGKSTFVQGINKYVEPTCSVNRTNIDCRSTQEPMFHQVKTDFPQYRLFTQPSKQVARREIDLDKLTRKLASKYSTPLYPSLFRRTAMDNLSAGAVCEPMATSSSTMSILNIVDASPIDGTRGEEVRHVANLLSELRRLGSINLVLIMVSSTTPITVYNEDSLKAFAEICPKMEGLIAFVHTKARLQDLSCSRWEEDMLCRKRTLEKIFCRSQRSPIHFDIDCDLTARDPALIAIRQRVIQKILLRATKTKPVDICNMPVFKSKKMSKVDAEVVVQFHMMMRDLVLNQTTKLGDCRLRIKELKRFIENAEEFIGKYDSDAPVVMFETSREDDWTVWDPFSFGREMVIEALDLPYDIIHLHEECSGFEKKVLHRSSKSYRVQLTRKHYTRGTYRLQILTTFKTQYQEQLARRRTWLKFFERTLRDLEFEAQYDIIQDQVKSDAQAEAQLQVQEDARAKAQRQVQENAQAEVQLERSRNEMIKRWESCLSVIRHADQLTLSMDAFIKAARAQLYEGYAEDCVDKAVNYFTNTEFRESADSPDQEE